MVRYIVSSNNFGPPRDRPQGAQDERDRTTGKSGAGQYTRHGCSQGCRAREDGPPAKKVADAYRDTNKNKPVDDRIKILGIPAEQITPATQAALASLVAEVNFMQASVRRLENAAAAKKRDPSTLELESLPADTLLTHLARIVAEPLPQDLARVLVMAYGSTYEDVRRSSGLLTRQYAAGGFGAAYGASRIHSCTDGRC